ncbi:MAG: hypothetical protein FJ206_15575 [Gemmatimonadetes bacterium]|nr:hypothetical protein [Gemmatimonadota bacterium]
MNINPSSPQGPRAGDSASIEAQRAQDNRLDPTPSATDRAAPKVRTDSAEVSAEAKALAEGTETPPRSTLSAERLQEISERLASNYYDRPEVIETVAKRLAADPNLRVEDPR